MTVARSPKRLVNLKVFRAYVIVRARPPAQLLPEKEKRERMKRRSDATLDAARACVRRDVRHFGFGSVVRWRL